MKNAIGISSPHGPRWPTRPEHAAQGRCPAGFLVLSRPGQEPSQSTAAVGAHPRRGIHRLPCDLEKGPKRKRFAETAIGCVHVDACELRLAEGKPHMFLVIDP
jgi:hypothetical protein